MLWLSWQIYKRYLRTGGPNRSLSVHIIPRVAYQFINSWISCKFMSFLTNLPIPCRYVLSDTGIQFWKINFLLFKLYYIIPKSIDISFDKDIRNLICLTPKEHYLAHRILCKCFYGIIKRNMCFAFRMMCRVMEVKYGLKKNGTAYDWVRSQSYEHTEDEKNEN